MKSFMLSLAAMTCMMSSIIQVSAQAKSTGKIYLDTSDLIQKTASPALKAEDHPTLERYGRDKEAEFKGKDRERKVAQVMLDLEKDPTLLKASKATGNASPKVESLRADVFFAEYFDQMTAEYLKKNNVSAAEREVLQKAAKQIKSEQYLAKLNEVLASDLGLGPDRETNAARRVLLIRSAFSQLKPSELRIGPKGEALLPHPLCDLFPPCPK